MTRPPNARCRYERRIASRRSEVNASAVDSEQPSVITEPGVMASLCKVHRPGKGRLAVHQLANLPTRALREHLHEQIRNSHSTMLDDDDRE